MALSLYIYGPAGCGKSTNAKRLLAYFGLQRVVDDFHYENIHRQIRTHGDLVIGQSIDHAPYGVRTLTYDEAATQAGIALKVKVKA